jgi:hypothetical protein
VLVLVLVSQQRLYSLYLHFHLHPGPGLGLGHHRIGTRAFSCENSRQEFAGFHYYFHGHWSLRRHHRGSHWLLHHYTQYAPCLLLR